MTKQCLSRRLDNMNLLHSELSAWELERNNNHSVVDWQFTSDNARIKLASLYPSLD